MIIYIYFFLGRLLESGILFEGTKISPVSRIFLLQNDRLWGQFKVCLIIFFGFIMQLSLHWHCHAHNGFFMLNSSLHFIKFVSSPFLCRAQTNQTLVPLKAAGLVSNAAISIIPFELFATVRIVEMRSQPLASRSFPIVHGWLKSTNPVSTRKSLFLH